MKKINLLLVLGIVSFFSTSCTEDEDTNYTPKNYLAGKWTATKIGHLEVINNVEYAVYEDYVNNSECDNDNIIFNEDATYQLNDYEFIDGACSNNTIEGDYDLEGSTIVLNYLDDANLAVTETRVIKTLSFTEMEIAYTDSVTHQIVLLKMVKE